jgi:hypothetical protein
LRQGLDLFRELCGQVVAEVEAEVAEVEAEVVEWRERPRSFPEPGLISVNP